jgi:hypothetical protein
MKVGVIGLGAMGLPMAARVVSAGFQTFTTFHKHCGPANTLAGLGASLVPTPAEVARCAGKFQGGCHCETTYYNSLCGAAGPPSLKSFPEASQNADATHRSECFERHDASHC